MSFFCAVVLGLIQGLCEFLPVSSSGHLVLVQQLLGLKGDFLWFDILLHGATLLAVCFVLRKEIWQMIKNPLQKRNFVLAVSCVPTVIIVLLFKKQIDAAFAGGLILAAAFFVTAVLLFVTERLTKRCKAESRQVGFLTALIMGTVQGVATIPGISRSGSTVCAGLLCGEEKEEATKFSFLMSIPIILASMVYEFSHFKTAQNIAVVGFWPALVSFLVAFLTGFFAVKLMLQLVKRAKLKWFSLYLAVLSVVVFIANI